MANTYKALQTVTVGAGGVASVSFTNIPQTYTDLAIKTSYRTNRNAAADTLRIAFNNGTTYNIIYLYGNGTSTTGFSGSSSAGIEGLWGTDDSNTANIFGNSELYIPNYVSNNAKVTLDESATENNATLAYIGMGAGISNSTSPITSITLTSNTSSTIKQYSTFTLYGVFNADVSSAPATPTIGTATAGNTTASITFTGVSNAVSYTMTSTPSSITGTGTTSPITVSGLTNETAYTFKVKSNNPFGSSAESAASNSVTPSAGVYDFIATSTLGSSASTITFTALPQTYTRLQIRCHLIPTTNATSASLYFNNDLTSGNYGAGEAYAVYNGSAYGNVALAYANSFPFLGTSQGIFTTYGGVSVIDIEQYTNTSAYTTYNAFSGFTYTSAESYKSEIGRYYGIWKDTSAVTRLDFTISSGQYAAGSYISIYGVKG